jgi:hypothetical protein
MQRFCIVIENTLKNIYMFDYRSNTSDFIGESFGIDFTNKRLRLNEIKNILASSKK